MKLLVKKDIESYRRALRKLADFLTANEKVVNACMVDFVTKDTFGKVIPESVGRNLLSLNEEQK